jgi:hypothetical protein
MNFLSELKKTAAVAEPETANEDSSNPQQQQQQQQQQQRPSFLLGLGGGNGNGGDSPRPKPPPFMLGGNGGGGMLKKAVEKKKLVDYDITELLKTTSISPTDRMRQLSLLHMHSPTAEETKLLNIPDDRLVLFQLKSMLLLCGGMRGTRFETEDLATLRQLSSDMETTWGALDKAFNALDSKSKRSTASTAAVSATTTTSSGNGSENLDAAPSSSSSTATRYLFVENTHTLYWASLLLLSCCFPAVSLSC